MNSVMKFAFLGSLIVLSAVLLGGCKTTSAETLSGAEGQEGTARIEFGADAPRWVLDGRAPGYDSGQYILGLGYSPRDLDEADAYESAKLDAFTDISGQVETYVESEFTSIQRSVFHNENLDELVDLKSIAKQVSKEVFGGIKVVERYYDSKPGAACVFAVMNRAKFSQRQLKDAEESRTALDGFMKGFEQAKEQNDLSQTLKSLIHAHGSLNKIMRAHAKAIAVGQTRQMDERFKQLSDPELAALITQELNQLSNSIRIVPVSGNEQKANLTGLIKDPIVVVVRHEKDAESVPLPAFPMRVRVEDKDKATAVPQGNTTDQEGRFSFNLQELKATGSASNTVAVELDYGALDKHFAATPPSLDITYFMPTRDTTRIGVLIFETIDGKKNPRPHTGSTIKDALTDMDFQVIRLELDSSAETVVDLSPTQLRERFDKQCDYIIVGTAEAEYSTAPAEKLHFSYARLVIDALELESGKTVHFEVPMGGDTKGGGGTKIQSLRKALENAAKVMVGNPKDGKPGALAEKFISRFEEGADWSDS